MRCAVGMPSALGEDMSNPVEKSEKGSWGQHILGENPSGVRRRVPGDLKKRAGDLHGSGQR